MLLLRTNKLRNQGVSINTLNDKQSLHKGDRSESMLDKRQDSASIFEGWYYNQHVVHNVNKEEQEELVAFSMKGRKTSPTICKLDTDSYAIGVGSYASRCISPFIVNFVKGSLKPQTGNKTVRPYGKGNILSIAMVGTIKWRFQDDNSITHKFYIRNSFLVPDGTMRLLLPQHFASNCNNADFDTEKFCSTQF